jgi:hypothetical protein
MPTKPDRQDGHRDSSLDGAAVSNRTVYVVVGGLVVVAVAVVLTILIRRPIGPVVPTPTAAPVQVTTTARFTMLAGTVKVKPQAELDWKDATREMVLHRDDLVRTGRESTAEITFFDGTVLRVEPGGLIKIEESSENPRTNERKSGWHVSSGVVNYGTGASGGTGSSIEVTTPTLRMHNTGQASGAISVADTGASDVRVFSGQSEVQTRAGQTVKVAANQGVRISAAGQASATVSLPDAPALLRPVSDANLAYPNPSVASTTLTWKEVPGAQAYRVVVDVTPQFYRPMFDRLNTGTSVRLQGLDVGQYCWRVAVVDAQKTEGRFSDFARFSVQRSPTEGAGEKPELTIQAFDLRANILQIKGKTDPGATVFVNGEALTVHADGSFNEFVTFAKLGPQDVKVRAVAARGGTREETRSVVVAF